MNKVFVMAGAILAITALATGSFVPYVEAITFNDNDSKMKVRCLVKDGKAFCLMIDKKNGIDNRYSSNVRYFV